MNAAPNRAVCPGKFWLSFLSALLLAGVAIVLVEPFQAGKANTATVTYTRGVLNVTLRYHAISGGD